MKEDIIEKKRSLTQYLSERDDSLFYKIDIDTILPDKELIVASLTLLEFEEMYLIFDIFPYELIREVWIAEMVSVDCYNSVLNKLLAYLFFGVKNYKKFRKEVCGKEEEEDNSNFHINLNEKIAEAISRDYPFVSGYQFVKMPEGWWSCTITMLHRIKEYLTKRGIEDFMIREMSEKFGYGDCKTTFSDDTINDILRDWTSETYNTCCVCGEPATKYTDDWIRPYCDDCFSNKKKQK